MGRVHRGRREGEGGGEGEGEKEREEKGDGGNDVEKKEERGREGAKVKANTYDHFYEKLLLLKGTFGDFHRVCFHVMLGRYDENGCGKAAGSRASRIHGGVFGAISK